MKFLSIVVLSYNRPGFLQRSIQSIKETTVMDYELLIVDDGSHDESARDLIARMIIKKEISTAIYNAGKNMGVGESVRRGFAVAQGDYLVKSDQDLIYQKGWDTEMVKILENKDIGMVGGFKYYVNHETAGWENSKPELVEKDDLKYYTVNDFVSSMFMMKKTVYDMYGPIGVYSDAFAEDCVLKIKLQKNGYKLALTEKDLVQNIGFGIGENRSTLFTKQSMQKALETSDVKELKTVKINKEPLIFNKEKHGE